MPTLNSYSLQQTPGGGMQPSPQSLAAVGPVIQIRIEVPSALAASLVAASQIVPNPIDGIALIDTGATITSIHAPILVGMGINPVGVATVGTAGGPKPQSAYAARVSFPGTPLPGFELAQIIGCDLTGQTVLNQQPLIGLIGRDILSRAVLVYNGSA